MKDEFKLINAIKHSKNIAVLAVQHHLEYTDNNLAEKVISIMLNEDNDKQARLSAFKTWLSILNDGVVDGVTVEDFEKVLDGDTTIVLLQLQHDFDNYDEACMDDLDACIMSISSADIRSYMVQNLNLFMNVRDKSTLDSFVQRAKYSQLLAKDKDTKNFFYATDIWMDYMLDKIKLNSAFYKNNASCDSYTTTNLIVNARNLDNIFQLQFAIRNTVDSEHLYTRVYFTADEVVEMLFV